MALKSTANLETYKHNLDVIGDKDVTIKDLIDELQAKVAALATLANETKSVVNVGSGQVESPDVTI